MSRRITMRVIADELGLAESAVSRALSGKKGVSEQTRRRIIAAARRRGYVVKMVPAPMPVQITLLVERVLHEMTYWGTFINGLVAEMSLNDSYLSVVVTDEGRPFTALPPPFDQVGKVDGVIAVRRTDPRVVQAARQIGLPVVLVDYIHKHRFPGCDLVMTDGHDGVFTMATELIKIGHRRFGFVGDLKNSHYRIRYEGLQAAIASTGIADEVQRFLLDDLAQGELPAALICPTDILAANVINLLLKRGVHVPEDVSVIGFDDNIDYVAKCPIPLTTVHVDQEELGCWAVRTLFQRLNNPTAPPVQVLVGVTPIWRQSCAKPRD